MENTAKEEIIKKAIETGQSIEVRFGEAPEIHNPNPVSISGTIDAVSRFIEKRRTEFSPLKAHCLVSKSKGQMELIVNEQSTNDKYNVVAKIYIGRRFEELGINTDKSYTPAELSKKFKLLRSIFPSRAEHGSLVALLRNFNAKISSDVDKKDDARGNVTIDFKQAVSSNVPDSFKLNLPLLEGQEPTEIEVHIVMEVESGNTIRCWLESVDGADLIEDLRNTLIDQEVEKIKDDCTVIYY